jgi:hypothetical protein
MRQFPAILTKISAIIFRICVILWLISYFFSYCFVAGNIFFPAPSVPLLGDFRCSVYKGGIWLFNSNFPLPLSPDFKGDSDTWSFLLDGRPAARIQDWQWKWGGATISQWTFHGEDHEFAGMTRDGDMPGINYRHRQGTKKASSISTLRVSLLYPVFIFGFVPAMRLLHARYGRNRVRAAIADGPPHTT